MFKTAFSTVSCWDWTLDQVCRSAAEWGYDGIEMRTFGAGSTQFACDPALTSDEKVRRILGQNGIEPAVLASSVGFGEPIRPPVLGRVFRDTERSVREAKGVIELAARLECPLVRVFGFEYPRTEKRKSALRRITERLSLAADAARNTGVRIVVENGGSFNSAEDLNELVRGVNSNLVGAAYSVSVGAAADDDPAEAVTLLGDRLWVCKLRDRDDDHRLRPIGEGTVPCRTFVEALAKAEFSGWMVVEWDRAWVPGLAAAETVLPGTLERIYEWSGMRVAIH
jgi:sugar phosphate isomerase/epimerase